jgi:hypothetical protein
MSLTKKTLKSRSPVNNSHGEAVDAGVVAVRGADAGVDALGPADAVAEAVAVAEVAAAAVIAES